MSVLTAITKVNKSNSFIKHNAEKTQTVKCMSAF